SPLATLRDLLDYYGHSMLLYFAQLSGIITVIAACGTLARLHRANELTAILASGTSLYRVAWPIVLAGLMTNGLWLIDQELIIPSVADRLARRHDDMEGRNVYPIWFLPDRDNQLLSARRFLPRTGEMRGLFVLERDAEGRLVSILRADHARWDPDRGNWALTVGTIERPASAVGFGTGAEGQYRSPVASYESKLTPADIVVQQASQWTNFLSLAQITAVQKRFANDRKFVVVKHVRITTPIMSMILLLMGVPFFLTRERVSLVVSGGWCILACSSCFVFSFFTQNADFTTIISDPALAVWLPTLIFGPVAVFMVDGIKT
ncbi:MAG: LptF/LptG family permease, partial [Phycisphaerae bacterium]